MHIRHHVHLPPHHHEEFREVPGPLRPRRDKDVLKGPADTVAAAPRQHSERRGTHEELDHPAVLHVPYPLQSLLEGTARDGPQDAVRLALDRCVPILICNQGSFPERLPTAQNRMGHPVRVTVAEHQNLPVQENVEVVPRLPFLHHDFSCLHARDLQHLEHFLQLLLRKTLEILHVQPLDHLHDTLKGFPRLGRYNSRLAQGSPFDA
mmetsp:Transcript_45518/g.120233  ORF Transcript_45518/g.120233 Transcript_45518/m.120233 type:complete len:207 (-) Transcript_45518:437-1057(-)